MGIPIPLQRLLTVPLNSPNGRQMPAVRAVQEDFGRVYICRSDVGCDRSSNGMATCSVSVEGALSQHLLRKPYHVSARDTRIHFVSNHAWISRIMGTDGWYHNIVSVMLHNLARQSKMRTFNLSLLRNILTYLVVMRLAISFYSLFQINYYQGIRKH